MRLTFAALELAMELRRLAHVREDYDGAGPECACYVEMDTQTGSTVFTCANCTRSGLAALGLAVKAMDPQPSLFS